MHITFTDRAQKVVRIFEVTDRVARAIEDLLIAIQLEDNFELHSGGPAKDEGASRR
jgi:hypothetical protein